MLHAIEFKRNNMRKLERFEKSNVIKSFFNQNSRTVKLIILLNKSRLILEIKKRKDLVTLLERATHKGLSLIGKRRVKNQLIDICKTIPSLTHLLLPRGSVLFPLLIRPTPELFPSAFNENINNLEQIEDTR